MTEKAKTKAYVVTKGLWLEDKSAESGLKKIAKGDLIDLSADDALDLMEKRIIASVK